MTSKQIIIRTSQGTVSMGRNFWKIAKPSIFLEGVFREGNTSSPRPGTELVRSLSVGDWIDYPLEFAKQPMRVKIESEGFSVVKEA